MLKKYIAVLLHVLFTLDLSNGAEENLTNGSKTEDAKPSFTFFFKTLGHQDGQSQLNGLPFGFNKNFNEQGNGFNSFLNNGNNGIFGNQFAKGFTIPGLENVLNNKKTEDFEAVPQEDYSDKPQSQDCEISLTTVNQKRVCRGAVIFKEDFYDKTLPKWTKDQFIPAYGSHTDMVFNYFNVDNVKAEDGSLYITPTIVDDAIVRRGELKLNPCSGTLPEECEKKAQFQWILPPVSSGRVSTKNSFSFKYGTVEVLARVPKGDWLVPELWLLPKRSEYGPGLESGRIAMVMIRGNDQLVSDGVDLSNRILDSSLTMSSGDKVRSRTLRVKSDDPWYSHTNKYIFQWRPDEITVSVNGIGIGNILYRNSSGTLASLAGFTNEEQKKWLRGSAFAPFDEEFYLSFGLSVGGRDFPDDSFSGGYTKPWKTGSVKELVDFWRAKNYWEPTWKKDSSSFKIQSIRVKSL